MKLSNVKFATFFAAMMIFICAANVNAEDAKAIIPCPSPVILPGSVICCPPATTCCVQNVLPIGGGVNNPPPIPPPITPAGIVGLDNPLLWLLLAALVILGVMAFRRAQRDNAVTPVVPPTAPAPQPTPQPPAPQGTTLTHNGVLRVDHPIHITADPLRIHAPITLQDGNAQAPAPQVPVEPTIPAPAAPPITVHIHNHRFGADPEPTIPTTAPKPVRPTAEFCPSCGTQLSSGARFCQGCGHALPLLVLLLMLVFSFGSSASAANLPALQPAAQGKQLYEMVLELCPNGSGQIMGFKPVTVAPAPAPVTPVAPASPVPTLNAAPAPASVRDVTARRNIGKVTSRVTTLEKEMADVKARAGSKDPEVTQLKQKVTELTANLTKLSQQQSPLSVPAADISRLDNQYAQLRTRVDGHDEQIGKLGASVGMYSASAESIPKLTAALQVTTNVAYATANAVLNDRGALPIIGGGGVQKKDKCEIAKAFGNSEAMHRFCPKK